MLLCDPDEEVAKMIESDQKAKEKDIAKAASEEAAASKAKKAKKAG